MKAVIVQFKRDCLYWADGRKRDEVVARRGQLLAGRILKSGHLRAKPRPEWRSYHYFPADSFVVVAEGARALTLAKRRKRWGY